jgi:hypothetical protein
MKKIAELILNAHIDLTQSPEFFAGIVAAFVFLLVSDSYRIA